MKKCLCVLVMIVAVMMLGCKVNNVVDSNATKETSTKVEKKDEMKKGSLPVKAVKTVKSSKKKATVKAE